MSQEVVDFAPTDGPIAARRRAISLVAKAGPAAARARFAALPDRPAFTALRSPELGLVMVRGRVGGAGKAFNLGEMTVARAAVRLAGGEVGVGYVAGRDKAHAELAALADAMVQAPAWAEVLERVVLTPLAQGIAEAHAARSRKAAATKVEFFTMVRTRAPK